MIAELLAENSDLDPDKLKMLGTFLAAAGTVLGSFGAAFVHVGRRRSLEIERDAAASHRRDLAEIQERADNEGALVRRILELRSRGSDNELSEDEQTVLLLDRMYQESLSGFAAASSKERELYARYHEMFLKQSSILSTAALVASIGGFIILGAGAVFALSAGVAVGILTAVTGIIVEVAAKMFDAKADAAKRDAMQMFIRLERTTVKPVHFRQALLIADRMKDGPKKEQVLSKLALEMILESDIQQQSQAVNFTNTLRRLGFLRTDRTARSDRELRE